MVPEYILHITFCDICSVAHESILHILRDCPTASMVALESRNGETCLSFFKEIHPLYERLGFVHKLWKDMEVAFVSRRTGFFPMDSMRVMMIKWNYPSLG